MLIENNLVYTSAKKGGKGVFEDTPKTGASARVIDISDDASDLLRQLRIEQSRACISPYVFFAGWSRRANAPDLADAIFCEIKSSFRWTIHAHLRCVAYGFSRGSLLY